MSKEKYTTKDYTNSRLDDVEALLSKLQKVVDESRTDTAIAEACRRNNINIRQFQRLMNRAPEVLYRDNISDTSTYKAEHMFTPQERIYMRIMGDHCTTVDIYKEIPPGVNKNVLPVLKKVTNNQQYEYFIDHYFKGMSYPEIADKNGMTIEQLQSDIEKVLRKIRNYAYITELNYGPDYTKKLANIRKKAYEEHWNEMVDEAIQSGEKNAAEQIKAFQEWSQKQHTPVGDIPITALGLSTRTLNCLRRGCIFNISDLTKCTEDDLHKIRRFGKNGINEVIEKLKEYNVTLRPADTPEIVEYVNDSNILSDDTSLANIKLSQFARNTLQLHNVETVGDLINIVYHRKPNWLKNIPGLIIDEIETTATHCFLHKGEPYEEYNIT